MFVGVSVYVWCVCVGAYVYMGLVMCGLCVGAFCNVWVCVCVGFVICGWVCVCVCARARVGEGFVLCGCVYVLVCVCGVVM